MHVAEAPPSGTDGWSVSPVSRRTGVGCDAAPTWRVERFGPEPPFRVDVKATAVLAVSPAGTIWVISAQRRTIAALGPAVACVGPAPAETVKFTLDGGNDDDDAVSGSVAIAGPVSAMGTLRGGGFAVWWSEPGDASVRLLAASFGWERRRSAVVAWSGSRGADDECGWE